MVDPVIILFGLYAAADIWDRRVQARNAEQERRLILQEARLERIALENRLIALTDRDASVLVSAQERFEPGDVTYVDERREFELDQDLDD